MSLPSGFLAARRRPSKPRYLPLFYCCAFLFWRNWWSPGERIEEICAWRREAGHAERRAIQAYRQLPSGGWNEGWKHSFFPSLANQIVVSIAVDEKYRTQNPEVLYTRDTLTSVDRSEINHFKQLSSANPRKRVRLCAHADPEDRLHEMLIVHERGAYVRPHKHPGKTESTHVIEGLVDVVVFADDGQIVKVLHVGDYASGRTFYYRMGAPAFHTLLIRSEVLVFHEITNGPFDRNDTVFAPWAPPDHDAEAVGRYITELEDKVRHVG